MTALLTVRGLDLDTPGDRPLIRDLTMVLEPGDRVAIVGRNGVGKSTLLHALAGELAPRDGLVRCDGTLHAVGQLLDPGGRSPGLSQRLRLEAAFETSADLLLLDEPTHDLDADGLAWLTDRIHSWKGGLVIVSHERRLLRTFEDFFVVAESGCRHFRGTFEALQADHERRAAAEQDRYVRTLNDLVAREQDHERTRRRRERKRNRGRIRELDRGSPRSVLNGKRGYAQASEGRRNRIQEERLGNARAWAKATLLALAVDLPLELVLPEVARPTTSLVTLEGVSIDGIFGPLDLDLRDDRLAIVGQSGAGKSTLVEVMMGERTPSSGRVRTRHDRIAYVAQNASNWRLDATLLERVAQPLDDAAALLRAHRFPLALADRPMRDLSPGERLRAALICAFAERPELLVLDEPTDHLDFAGLAALERILRAWLGGLVVVSHDAEFLAAVGVRDRLELERRPGACAQPALPSKNPSQPQTGSDRPRWTSPPLHRPPDRGCQGPERS